MTKPTKQHKHRPGAAAPASGGPAYSPGAQELRALLRRVPDGFQATLNALAARPVEERERVMGELVRGMGKEILPLVRAAATGANDDLALSGVRVLPLFGTRAAGDALVEAYQLQPEGERARAARQGALALQARGVNVAVPGGAEPEAPKYVLRETLVSPPDGVGSRSVAARLQDGYGVWHSIFILWNDQAGVKDGFMRPVSRHEWTERIGRVADRGLSWAACPPDFARWQLARAREINARTGFPLEHHLEDWDRWLGPPPAEYEPPDPTQAVRAAAEEEASAWLRNSQDLFEVPDARRWFMEAADAIPWARRWLDIQDRFRRRGETDPLKREVFEIVREAAAKLVDAEQQHLWRERLLDFARVFEWRQAGAAGDLAARRAAAAVVAIDNGVEPVDNPFFIGLVQRTLSAAEAILRRGEDPERLRHNALKR